MRKKLYELSCDTKISKSWKRSLKIGLGSFKGVAMGFKIEKKNKKQKQKQTKKQKQKTQCPAIWFTLTCAEIMSNISFVTRLKLLLLL